MVGEELRPGVQVDVGPVGEVEPQALEVHQQGQLVAHEVRRAGGPGLRIGAVERDDAGPVGEALPPRAGPPVVEAVVAPEVVGLPRRHAVLDHVGRHGGVVADGEGHELLLTPAAHQFQQVAAREPVLGDADGHGVIPRAADGAGAGGQHGGGLGPGRHEVALPGEPSTQTLVVAHPVRLHLHGTRPGVDEQGDVVAADRAHLAGVALERMLGLDEVADPVQGAGLGVLGDEPGCRRHDDAARELGVDDGGEGAGGVTAGARRHAVLRLLGGEA